ncbi:MAG: hypothetical protein ACK4IS_01675 [Erythrobacter sp.]
MAAFLVGCFAVSGVVAGGLPGNGVVMAAAVAVLLVFTGSFVAPPRTAS